MASLKQNAWEKFWLAVIIVWAFEDFGGSNSTTDKQDFKIVPA